MAASPRFKIHNPCGYYVASCKHVQDAAMIVAAYGDGATIRDGANGRRILWNEGAEEISAGESYDRVIEIVFARIDGAAA